MVRQSSQRVKPYFRRRVFVVALQMSHLPIFVPIKIVCRGPDVLRDSVCFAGFFAW